MIHYRIVALVIASASLSVSVLSLQYAGSNRSTRSQLSAASAEKTPTPIVVGGCETMISHTLSTTAIRDCDTITVTTSVRSACESCPGDVNVVFVIGTWPNGISAAAVLVDSLERLRKDTGMDFNAAAVLLDPPSARLIVPLTDDLARVRSAVAQRRTYRGPGGYSRAASITRGLLRKTASLDPARCDIVVFYGQLKDIERFAEFRLELLRAARALRGDDLTLMAHCIDVADHDCRAWREVPSSLRFYGQEPDQRKIPAAVKSHINELADRAPGGMHSLGLEFELSENLMLITGSANPPPSEVMTGTSTVIRWLWERPDEDRVYSTSYRVSSLALGASRIEGLVEVKPRTGRRFGLPMTPVAISVTSRCAPTVTSTATPTDTPEPTSTSPATATLTRIPPSLTATPFSRPVYLPISLREVPCMRKLPADVVLVLDASTSMQGPAGDGRTKLEAARAAATAFVDLLRLDAEDQAAIVSFHRDARVVIGLTGDRTALRSALGAIATSSQTCLVCGLEAARVALDGDARRPSNQPVIILLTDGRSNPRPASEAMVEADRLKGRGVVIFTIGLGAELDDKALTAIASRPAFAFQSFNGAALEAIYREIAVTLPGPADCYWGRRR